MPDRYVVYGLSYLPGTEIERVTGKEQRRRKACHAEFKTFNEAKLWLVVNIIENGGASNHAVVLVRIVNGLEITDPEAPHVVGGREVLIRVGDGRAWWE